jgi:hypothetical protein
MTEAKIISMAIPARKKAIAEAECVGEVDWEKTDHCQAEGAQHANHGSDAGKGARQQQAEGQAGGHEEQTREDKTGVKPASFG